jgi:hypothetical protein
LVASDDNRSNNGASVPSYGKRLEYISLDPVFGRSFLPMPLKNNKISKEQVIEDFQALLKSLTPR